MNYNFSKIRKQFQINGTFLSCLPYGTGHINETFLLKTKENSSPDYILQRINHTIFKNVPGLMENIRKVTSHLYEKLTQTPGCNPEKEILTLVYTINNRPFLLDEEGNYWRMYLYIWPNRSYDIVPNGMIAYEGGKMFGKFLHFLSDFPENKLVETIPHFHNIKQRLETFDLSLNKDVKNRSISVKDEIKIVTDLGEGMSKIMELGRKNLISKRVTHNDTKFNNVLLDENDRGLCVIDLDTVMPGYIHYDFGDAIRTTANTGAEDERDLSKVELDIRIFEGFARGFLEETKNDLNAVEVKNLVFSGQLLTFTIGLRFLTDYLDGDVYFKIHREAHNLDRCRAQFKLLKSQMEQAENMERIIEEIMRPR